MMGYLEETPYKVNQDCTQHYLDFRKLTTDRSIWNESLRSASFYLGFPYFTTKMLQKFSTHKEELQDLAHFSNHYQNDPNYQNCSTFWKQYLDREFIDLDQDLKHKVKLSRSKKEKRKKMLESAHAWQLGNTHGENGIHVKNEGIIEYLKNIPGQKYWTVSFADFRGRLYQYGIWNPTGTKFNRALLYFDNTSKIDERSKYWLLVHAANTCGWNDKESNQVRYETALEKLPLIREIAKNPIGTIPLWEKFDNPWQAVSTFIEIDKIWAAEENGQAYETGLPIFQDGSCKNRLVEKQQRQKPKPRSRSRR